MSDLHLEMPENTAGDGPSALTVAQAIARDVAGLAEVLDLVVVSGDMTERADGPSFRAFEEMFSEIGLPVVVVPGNHDGPAGMRSYGATSKVFANWDITNRVVEFGGTRFLGLDTCVEGVTEGALNEEGLALVAEEVGRDNGRSRLVIVMHHPPLVLGLKRFDGFCRLEGRDRFMDILGSACEQVVILSGHVHRPYTATECKIACFVAGSMVAPYDSELPFGDLPIRPTTPQDFYWIHDFGPMGRHILTPQRVRELSR